MARARPSSDSDEDDSWGSALSGRSGAPTSPRATRSRCRASSEQVSSLPDAGNVELGSAVQRLLAGIEATPRRPRERVDTATCDNRGRPIPKDELRRIRRRKTNRESAARTRTFKALDKQQLREEVSQLISANALIESQLAAAQERIALVSADLRQTRSLYKVAVEEKDSLVQSLQAAGRLEASAVPTTPCNGHNASQLPSSLIPDVLTGDFPELSLDALLPAESSMPVDLHSLSAATYFSPIAQAASIPTGPTCYLPELTPLTLPAHSHSNQPQQCAMHQVQQYDAGLELAQGLSGLVPTFPSLDEILGHVPR